MFTSLPKVWLFHKRYLGTGLLWFMMHIPSYGCHIQSIDHKVREGSHSTECCSRRMSPFKAWPTSFGAFSPSQSFWWVNRGVCLLLVFYFCVVGISVNKHGRLRFDWFCWWKGMDMRERWRAIDDLCLFWSR